MPEQVKKGGSRSEKEVQGRDFKLRRSFVNKQERKTISIFRGRYQCDKQEGKNSDRVPWQLFAEHLTWARWGHRLAKSLRTVELTMTSA